MATGSKIQKRHPARLEPASSALLAIPTVVHAKTAKVCCPFRMESTTRSTARLARSIGVEGISPRATATWKAQPEAMGDRNLLSLSMVKILPHPREFLHLIFESPQIWL